jgi:repressor LexA
MASSSTRARPASPGGPSRPRGPGGRPGRKPKGTVPVVAPVTPDQPDPDHVLTWRQRKILRAIRDSVQTRGYPPSMREIGDAVGLTNTSSVSYQLSILQSKGYLHRDVGRARTMQVRMPGDLPVRPPDAVVGEGMLLLLEVVGDAAIGAAIADGDWVVIRPPGNAENGAVVDEAILGRVVAVLRRV